MKDKPKARLPRLAENKTAEALKVGLGKVSVFWKFEDVYFYSELHLAGLSFRLERFFGRRRSSFSEVNAGCEVNLRYPARLACSRPSPSADLTPLLLLPQKTSSNPPMKVYTYSQARQQLAQLLDDAREDG